MTSVSERVMRSYLSRSIASANLNKVHGLLAELDFRRLLQSLGFGDRVSPGGWIARRNRDEGTFGQPTSVFFPALIQPDVPYPLERNLTDPPLHLHTICATFHQTGISAYYCVPSILNRDDATSVRWMAMQLGLPTRQPYVEFPEGLVASFVRRNRAYQPLRYTSDASVLPASEVPTEFSKENLRVAFQTYFFSEIADIDGVFWGHQHTYPIEIKEKTAGQDDSVGQYFGLDVGPFVKLAFYAAKRGNLHSLFVVREIADTTNRELVGWWFITFETLARFASWTPRAGGTNMRGGASTTVLIPKSQFRELNAAALDEL
jgi:hypothetical protein